MFEIIQLCLTYAAMHKFCACLQYLTVSCQNPNSTKTTTQPKVRHEKDHSTPLPTNTATQTQ